MSDPQPGTASRPDRIALVHYLEAHYRRFLAEEVKICCEAMLVRSEQLTPRSLRAIAQQLLDTMHEGEQIIAAANTVPDDLLEMFVRVQTSPKWRELLEQSGLVYDKQCWRWVPKDGP